MTSQTHPERWPVIAVVGAGAVGCYFGGMLARAGAPVTLIGRPAHMDAIASGGLLLERSNSSERIPIGASTEVSAARGTEVVLVCVKTVDTEVTAQTLRPHLSSGTTVLSLQNGVDNLERMYSAAQIRALPAVVYVAAAMVAPGHLKHSGRGDLVIGDPSIGEGSTGESTEVQALARMFERAGIPCRVAMNIRAELWKKMTMNCAFNAISALARANYGRMSASPDIQELMRGALKETVAVAQAEGVSLSETEVLQAALQLGQTMSQATSSTSQDIARGKPTEIDSLNGYIARRGVQLGIGTPINQALYCLVKLLERSSPDA